MGFKFLAWNVEHFKAATPTRIQKVADHISAEDPDVFGILEFQAKKAARKLINEKFRKYDFGMTDSKRQLDFLIGWKRDKFEQVLYTQRRDFTAGNINLRPGGLLSFRERGQSAFTNMLFLHTDSGTLDKDYKNRQTMFKKRWKLKAAIEKLPVQGGKARLIVIGDLNTMGRAKPTSKPRISADREIKKLTEDALSAGMRLLSKSSDETWSRSNGSMKSNLDHAIASDDLRFQRFYFIDNPENTFEIEVDGWNNLTGNARKAWIDKISDHCALIGQTV